MVIYREEGCLAFARIERKTSVLRSPLLLKQSSLSGFHSSKNREERKSDGQVVSIKKIADEKRQK